MRQLQLDIEPQLDAESVIFQGRVGGMSLMLSVNYMQA